ncbi:DHH family phosphoesterase [Thermococcus sp. AM4]|uniref:DHH family phosphoesterase n=1 Tax=Thermococcus sp. (strain AM4) TaxID=246969 RepID=UPI000186FA30|nr:DHH family phosphoesterase [Thermococcus sp. AM4]EEB74662.1 Kef-type K+ transport systems (NAD-binding component fused to domain related to exopolyphosphatase) [Thermococcus sp. AM4]
MRILILGGGSIGRQIAEALKGEFEITIVEKDELRAKSLEESGFNVVQGDFSYTATLLKAGVDKANVVVITTRNLEAVKKTIYVIRTNNKDVPIVALLPDDMPKETMEDIILEEFEKEVRIDYGIYPQKAITEAFLRTLFQLGEKKNALMLFKKLKEIKEKTDSLLILTHNNPDPDAISSAVALSLIAQSVGLKTTIAHGGEITHHENQAFVNLLGINLRRVSKGSYEIRKHSAIAIVDAQPNGNLTVLEPEDREKIQILIDHHQIFQHLHELIPRDAFVDIREDVKASASILTEYIKALNIPLSETLATALFYGIYTDTKKFSQLSQVDLKAVEFLAGKVNHELLDRIEHPDISTETAEILARAILNRKSYKNVVISNVGFIRNRDALAESADFLLRLEGISTVLVFGIVDDYIEMSARTRDVRVNIGAVMKEAFGEIGSGGGHATMGGARIPLGLFKLAKDKNSLLKLAEEAITEKFLEALKIKEQG